ncbi:MAG: cation:proton antiporter [Terriglobales bacterium]
MPATMETTFFRDLAYVFGAAVVGGGVARALRQPLILGYVLGGFLIGPFTPGPTLSEVHQFETLAEIGVILLMYSIGLEFSFSELLQVKWVAVFGAPLGILMSVALGVSAGWWLAWSTTQGIAVGAIVSVASTMVLSRMLSDRGELRSPQGHVMIGITLVEDLAVVALTVLLPSLNNLTGGHFLALGIAVGKAVLILTPVMFLAAKLVPPLMKRVGRAGNEELYLLVVLALGFATAAVTQAVGLSLALGAFLAGLIVSESGMTRRMLDKLLPLRDAFVALFFVTIGALVDPRILISKPSLWGAILILTMLGKFVIWTAVVRLFRYPPRTALLVGLGLTQIGEFSYVLVRVARDAQLVTDDIYHAILAGSVITILLNGLLMKALPKTATPVA